MKLRQHEYWYDFKTITNTSKATTHKKGALIMKCTLIKEQVVSSNYLNYWNTDTK